MEICPEKCAEGCFVFPFGQVGLAGPVCFLVVLLSVSCAGGAVSCTVCEYWRVQKSTFCAAVISVFFFNVCPCYLCHLAPSGGRDVRNV